jgi:hypothetical protein
MTAEIPEAEIPDAEIPEADSQVATNADFESYRLGTDLIIDIVIQRSLE